MKHKNTQFNRMIEKQFGRQPPFWSIFLVIWGSWDAISQRFSIRTKHVLCQIYVEIGTSCSFTLPTLCNHQHRLKVAYKTNLDSVQLHALYPILWTHHSVRSHFDATLADRIKFCEVLWLVHARRLQSGRRHWTLWPMPCADFPSWTSLCYGWKSMAVGERNSQMWATAKGYKEKKHMVQLNLRVGQVQCASHNLDVGPRIIGVVVWPLEADEQPTLQNRFPAGTYFFQNAGIRNGMFLVSTPTV